MGSLCPNRDNRSLIQHIELQQELCFRQENSKNAKPINLASPHIDRFINPFVRRTMTWKSSQAARVERTSQHEMTRHPGSDRSFKKSSIAFMKSTRTSTMAR